MKNKKAVSEIVSYTLLIIIAVALSVLVYSFLRVYVPKERLSCPEDISLSIKEVSCNASGAITFVNITLENKGFFNITDAFIRIGQTNKTVKSQINEGKTRLLAVDPPSPYLSPGKEIFLSYNSTLPKLASLNLANGITYDLEVQPAVLTEKGLALCNNAVIREKFSCN